MNVLSLRKQIRENMEKVSLSLERWDDIQEKLVRLHQIESFSTHVFKRDISVGKQGYNTQWIIQDANIVLTELLKDNEILSEKLKTRQELISELIEKIDTKDREIERLEKHHKTTWELMVKHRKSAFDNKMYIIALGSLLLFLLFASLIIKYA